mgnify:CR=1 FL=1
MDGVNASNEGVLVLAATNTPWAIDTAFRRPGRFDRHVTVDRPTQKGRLELFKVHTREVPLAADVDLERLAGATIGGTLAFLLGIIATLIRSDLEIPEPVIRIFAIFLLFSIGLQGGRELATAELSNVLGAVTVTAAIVVMVPLVAFLVARYVIRLSIVDAAGVAALYGSVSSVTFVEIGRAHV